MNLVNFRDLNGMPTKDGRKLKEKRLLRSGEAVQLDEEAVATLMEHDLKIIVDFRSAYEAENAPADKIPGVSYVNYDIMADANENMASQENWLKHLDPNNADIMMKKLYHAFAVSPSSRNGYAQFIKTCLSCDEGAVLFHCAAGKDRTGLGAAIILKLLGVSDEDIFHDYLKTNENRKEANEHILEGYRQKGLTEAQLDALSMLYSAKKEYLESAFNAIESEYGSFENYIENGLSINSSEIESLKHLYLT
jgi:protein-tyrosine phosphatase